MYSCNSLQKFHFFFACGFQFLSSRYSGPPTAKDVLAFGQHIGDEPKMPLLSINNNNDYICCGKQPFLLCLFWGIFFSVRCLKRIH